MKDKIKYLSARKYCSIILFISLLLITISNALFLPFILNAVLQNTPINGNEYVVGIVMILVGISLFVYSIYNFEKEVNKERLILKLILVGLITIMLNLILSIIIGFVAKEIYKACDSIENTKTIIDLMSNLIHIPLNALIILILSNVVIMNKIFKGLKLKNYLFIVVISIISWSISFLFSMLDKNFVLLLIHAIVTSFVAGLVLIISFSYTKSANIMTEDK